MWKKYFNRKSVKIQPWTPLEVILNEFCLWITVHCMQRSRKWLLPHWIRLYLPPVVMMSGNYSTTTFILKDLNHIFNMVALFHYFMDFRIVEHIIQITDEQQRFLWNRSANKIWIWTKIKLIFDILLHNLIPHLVYCIEVLVNTIILHCD